MEATSGAVSWGNGVAWFFILVFFLVIIGLIIWWVLSIVLPRSACDREVRDLHSRDICAAGNVTIGGNLTVGGLTQEAAATIRALSLPPVPNPIPSLSWTAHSRA